LVEDVGIRLIWADTISLFGTGRVGATLLSVMDVSPMIEKSETTALPRNYAERTPTKSQHRNSIRERPEGASSVE